MKEINNQVIMMAHGLCDAQDISEPEKPTFPAEGSRSPHTDNVISVGKEWVPQKEGGHAPEPIQMTPTFQPAPSTLSPTASTVVTTPAVDGAGLSWDKRIHAGSKQLTVKGVWKRRKNTSDELFAQVTDELRGVSQVSPVAAPTPPAVTVQVEQPVMQTTHVQVEQPVTTVDEAYPDIQVPTSRKPVHSLISFKDNLPMVLTELVNNGYIDQDYIGQLNTHFGVSGIWEIAKDVTNCKALFDYLVEQGLITGMA